MIPLEHIIFMQITNTCTDSLTTKRLYYIIFMRILNNFTFLRVRLIVNL